MTQESTIHDKKLIIIMVGLPARGKSYITKNISNYLNWLGINTKIFNVGNKRRFQSTSNHSYDFFNPSNKDNVKYRDELALITMNDLLKYLDHENGDIGIFDATNSTLERRELLVQTIRQRNYRDMNDIENTNNNYDILFMESLCNDPDIIEKNILLKLNGPDYRDDSNSQQSLIDFRLRLKNYESCYMSVCKDELEELSLKFEINLSFIKIINIYELNNFNLNSSKLWIINKFLTNFNNFEKKIYISENFNKIHLLPQDNLSIFTDLSISQIPQGLKSYEIINEDINEFVLSLESRHTNLLIISNNSSVLTSLLSYFTHENFQLESESIYCINSKYYTNKIEEFEDDNNNIPILDSILPTRSNSLKSPVESFVNLRKLNEYNGKSGNNDAWEIKEEFIEN
ncbi:hypothetical protein WICMUC_003760 [Wickerhamomyces mucosus]|uniref:6-phosphofructo-2-kinase domain-containing protein n=1 Tax=Wickerhamomyces mucosus TaxID=1378264 RepID=A0A9P8PKP2_9ASCO|nr:hypothetical protein WICMUC_003760 [Wickerhamomyces mucosus]